MYDGPDYGLLLLLIAAVLMLAGFYWIHRIAKDIEDN